MVVGGVGGLSKKEWETACASSIPEDIKCLRCNEEPQGKIGILRESRH